MYLVAYDIKQMKPGCAIIQVGMGATPGIAEKFDSRHWEVRPTPDMKVYSTTPEQLAKLIQMTESAHKEKS